MSQPLSRVWPGKALEGQGFWLRPFDGLDDQIANPAWGLSQGRSREGRSSNLQGAGGQDDFSRSGDDRADECGIGVSGGVQVR